jgi:ankyrin repeat protein
MHEFDQLVYFIAEDMVSELSKALASGVDPNSVGDGGRSLLHWAAQEGSPATIEVLLDAGAKIDAQEDLGFTPLAIALDEAEYGRVEKTAKLLERGASPNVRITTNAGGSVLHTAASYGYFEIIKLLVQTNGIEINLRDDEGRTPLGFAKEHGSPDIIDYLIAKGAKE